MIIKLTNQIVNKSEFFLSAHRLWIKRGESYILLNTWCYEPGHQGIIALNVWYKPRYRPLNLVPAPVPIFKERYNGAFYSLDNFNIKEVTPMESKRLRNRDY